MKSKLYRDGYNASVFGASKDSCPIEGKQVENKHYWLAGWHDHKLGYDLNLSKIN